jgi:2,3-bisphosphoglycerate-dependent phosphoglycerate mutase
MQRFIIVRHCQATGQEVEAQLTRQGEVQAVLLKNYFLNNDYHIDQIISSHYKRAIDSIKPLAIQLNLPIHIDERLGERVLCDTPLQDWQELLAQTFIDLNLSFQGGESSRETMARAVAVIEEHSLNKTTVLVTHGNLMTLLLKHFDDRFGYQEWSELSNPDIYEILIVDNGQVVVSRLWEEKGCIL